MRLFVKYKASTYVVLSKLLKLFSESGIARFHIEIDAVSASGWGYLLSLVVVSREMRVITVDAKTRHYMEWFVATALIGKNVQCGSLVCFVVYTDGRSWKWYIKPSVDSDSTSSQLSLEYSESLRV